MCIRDRTETDKNVDQSIEEKGPEETVDLLKSEQENKKKERNAFQNFFFGTIMGEDAEYEKQIERIEPLLLNSLPQDVTSEDLAFLDDTMGEALNIFNIGDDDDGEENKMEGVKYAPQSVASSNISVNPEFSDNSKISYILQYGGGAVV